ncbi:hypothetical protein B9G98_03696 [Wickerhamiella sorbophila]|uniref:HIT domain-containing protein n=1 Tax=Wickerhamiella sorbophila TaxID=45607 RepID=A0A2T0FM70_9ASCO|nr:hypothetical protein B9G98_03696 [Wickerhamiella sorbophila]PRT56076.1 hypothetical protein B9G98_03696 [Wickerhamiella sorbophila]
MTCPFCEIVKGKEASHVVYESEHTIAFLDIQPLVSSRAHILLCPKSHYETLDKLAANKEASAEIGIALPILAKACIEATNSTAFNVVQNNGEAAGQVVHHVHFHIVMRDGDEHPAVKRTVDQLKKQFGIMDRARYTMQVFGRGQREDLVGDEMAKLIRSKL